MEIGGRVALVTGGASGIGLATAERLIADGAVVTLTDIDAEGGEAAARKIGASFEALDVSDAARWEEVVGAVIGRHGGLDIAYLNAGVTTYPASPEGGLSPFDIETLSLEAYRRILGANVDGVVLGARAVTGALRARGGGAIIATASVAGLIAFSPDPIYTMTKHAVVGLVRALAPALEPDNITVNAICPGGVATAILGADMAERAAAAGAALMKPSQIADAVAGAITSGETGNLYVCLLGRPHEKYLFAPLDLGPGLG